MMTMGLKLFNTLGRKLEDFKPIRDKEVRMYTCGPTVYGPVHIGNWRAYLVADILRRLLNWQGFEVRQASNLTDVDDKTILGSRQAGLPLADFTQKYIDQYFREIERFNILRPTASPKATDYVPQMIGMTEALLERGLAYLADDGVYFRVEAFRDYGQLAGLAGELGGLKERIKNDQYDKESAADFALWKFYRSEDGEVIWQAPFGRGRPGWHIECSVMSRELLGQPFDIHTGGLDLIFPHHTNEIAQSESLYSVKLANFWLHNEFVTVDGRKMSKSLGNIYTLADLEAHGFEALDFRYLTLITHYRHPLNFTWPALEAARAAYRRLIDLMADYYQETKSFDGKVLPDYKRKFAEALDDDLNTPAALSVLWQLIKDPDPSAQDKLFTILDFDQVLGLALREKIEVEMAEREAVPAEVKKLTVEREELRKNKEWNRADLIREQIKKLGYQIDDTEEGPRLRKIH